MPEKYRLSMQKEDIDRTLLNAILEPDSVTPGEFAVFTDDGQIIGSGKSAEDFATAPLTKNLALYVNAATGSDSNDGLNADRAKKTIMAAINAIPKNLGGHTANINIAAGTYPETVKIEGFYGSTYSNDGGVRLIGDNGNITGAKITGGIFAAGCCIAIQIRYIAVSGAYSGNTIGFRDCLKTYVNNVSVDATDNISDAVLFEQTDGSLYNVTINNCKKAAVINTSSTLYVWNLHGSGNAVGVEAGSAANGLSGLVIIGASDISADAKYKRTQAGVIIEDGVLIE